MATETIPKKITILKVLSPVKFLIKEIPSLEMSKELRDFMALEPKISEYGNNFYTPVNSIMPCRGDLVLVYHQDQDGGKWLRGKVQYLLETPRHPKASIYLVDNGTTTTVSKESILVVTDKNLFFKLPFQAKTFELPNLKPLSFEFQEDATLRRMCTEKWDTSAVEYVNKKFKEHRSAKVVITRVSPDAIYYGKLFIKCTGDWFSLNDALLSQRYACITPRGSPDSTQDIQRDEIPSSIRPSSTNRKEDECRKFRNKIEETLNDKVPDAGRGRGQRLLALALKGDEARRECMHANVPKKELKLNQNSPRVPIGRSQRILNLIEKQAVTQRPLSQFVSYPG